MWARSWRDAARRRIARGCRLTKVVIDSGVQIPEKLVVGEIHDESVTVADQMEWLLGRMQTERSFVFSRLFEEGVSLRRLVATFLAVLELTRLRRMRLSQNDAFTDILCEALDEKPLESQAAASTVEL